MRSEGLDFLIAEARQGPLTIIATGPATDVASLLLVAPEVAGHVRVVWLGGFPDAATFRRWRFGELNGRADIAAWRVLLEQPVALLQLPGWPGVVKLAVEAGTYATELRALGRPVADYLATILVGWMASNAEIGRGDGRKVIWDIANVAAVINPACVTVTPLPCPTLDAAGAHDFDRLGRTVDMVMDVDARWVFDDMRAALLRHPAA